MSQRHIRFGYGTFVVACAAAVFLSMATATPALAQDAVQWTEAEGGNGHWYEIKPEGSTWTQARSNAESVGGHLASITSAEEESFLEVLMLDNGWVVFQIGGYQTSTDDEPGGNWAWVTGEPMVYTNWNPDEPSDSGQEGEQFLAFTYEHDGGWNDHNGNGSDPHIIEWSADCNGDGIVDYGQILDGMFSDDDGNGVPDCCEDDSCPVLVQWRVEDGGNGHWYAKFSAPEGGGPFATFENMAVELGGHLVSVNSEEEDTFLLPLVEDAAVDEGILIGTQVPADCSSFAWTDGSTWGYTNWGASQPKCKTGDGIAYYPDGWHDVYDNHVNAYLIEWSADCNGDGIVDYGQILDGTLNDTDANGVPDCCDDGECLGDIVGLHQVGYWVQAEDYNGEIVDRYVVDLYLVAETNDPVALNVYNLEINLGCTTDELACYWQAPWGPGWLPNNQGGVFDTEAVRRADSFVTIGGTGATTDHPDQMGGNGTGLDPNFGGNDACTPGIPGEKDGDGVMAGWYNSDPAIPNGVATNHAALGSSPGVFIGRFSREQAFEMCGLEISVTWNYGLGTDGHQITLVLPKPSNCDDDDGDGVANCDDKCPGENDNDDADGDGIPDECDICPGEDDTKDTDGDEIPDCIDPCPYWPQCSGDGQTLYVLVGDSIQAAINVVPDGGTIEIAAGTFQPGGTLDTAGRAMTIRGAVDGDGAPTTIIDGQNADRVLQCINSEGPDTVFENLLITGGDTIGFGGGMYCDGSSPTLRNCVFAGNSAVIAGGGMYNSGSSPMLMNCTFTDNSADLDGGGMYNDESSPTLENCAFEGNSADLAGGGMHNYSGSSPMLTDCTFNANSAQWGGGMRNAFSSSPTFTDCTFTDNSATFEGGGMANYSDSSPTLTNCTFESNSANYGGGMYSYESSPTLTGCTFADNSADDRGGGMYNYEITNPTLTNCTFTGNSATNGGGGMANGKYSSPTLTSCTFDGNSATDRGGGILNEVGSSPIVTDCDFVENLGVYGGGMANYDGSSPVVDGCTFSQNATSRGAGMFNYTNCSPTVTNCQFIENTGTSRGGAIRNYGDSNPTFIHCLFQSNSADDIGGAMFNSNSSSPVIDSCFFTDNTAVSGGGAIWSESEARPDIEDSVLCGNLCCGSVPDQISGPYDDLGGNAIADSCDGLIADCNGDGIHDLIQIIDGTFADCDRNGVLDVCELNETFVDSEPRTPRTPSDFIEFDVSAMGDAGDTVALQVSALGDYGSPASFMSVYLDEVFIGFAFDTEGQDCVEISVDIEISAEDWNDEGLDGERKIRISGTSLQPTLCDPDRFTAVDVTVPLIFDDCNANGIWDVCDFADGTVDDTDGDGVMDECDICPGSDDNLDTDGDGTPDCIDLCPTWPYECSDDGAIVVVVGSSIQAAIDVVPDGGTIEIAAGTFQPGGTLDTGGRAMTIQGAVDGGGLTGAPTTIIDGQNAHRVLQCISGEGADTVFENLVISHGASADGGGMYLEQASPTLINCRFEYNTSTGGVGYHGGGIYATDQSDLHAIDCEFIGNHSHADGGAIYALDSNIVLDNCTFTNNSATYEGGSIWAANGGSINLTECFFSGSSGRSGGAVGAQNDVTLTMSGCEFTDNTASDWGGGVLVHSGHAEIVDCTFTSNEADDGGGLLTYLSSFQVEDCVFTDNTASSFGGGMNNAEGGSGSIRNCTFQLNDTPGAGGGVYLEDLGNEDVIEECTFTGNSATSRGGGLCMENSTATLNNCTFEGNLANDGGGIYALGSDITASGSHFESNACEFQGGGMCLVGGSHVIQQCEFLENTSTNGAGIYINAFGEASIFDCEFEGNLTMNEGGGLFAYTATVQFEQCRLSGNTAFQGGAAYNSSSSFDLNTTISCDNGVNQFVGGYNDNGGNCIAEFCDSDNDGVPDCVDICPGEDDTIDTDGDEIPDCIDPCPYWPHCSGDGQTLYVLVGESIQDAINYVPDGGTIELEGGAYYPGAVLDTAGRAMTIRGAVDSLGEPTSLIGGLDAHRVLQCLSGEGSDTVFENLWIRGGYHPNDGGGMLIEGSSPTLRNMIFELCNAVDGGGVRCSTNASPTFEGCLFINNGAAVGGGAYSVNSSPRFVSCEFAGNTATSDTRVQRGGGVYCRLGGTPEFDGCLFGNNVTGEWGGGLCIESNSPTIMNCAFIENAAGEFGGGIYSFGGGDPSLENTQVCGNAIGQVDGDYTDLGGNCIIEECGDDLDGNGVPDECDPDCDGDGYPDAYEIAQGTQLDCDDDGIPDDCAIDDGLVPDCNDNGVPDECDITNGTEQDVNTNGIPDTCDLLAGDFNLDGCVDGADLGLMIAYWGLPNPPIGDLNQDGIISGADLGLLLDLWEPCDP